MAMTTEELKQKVILEFDPDDILDALEISSEDLLDRFEDRLIDKAYKFMEFDDEAV